MEVAIGDIVLCEFYFSDLQSSKRRPVIVFKDNLPFDDFVGIPVSSKITNLHDDEYILEISDVTEGTLPKRSKIIIRKTFVISKRVIVKKYGKLTQNRMDEVHQNFCRFFGCC